MARSVWPPQPPPLPPPQPPLPPENKNKKDEENNAAKNSDLYFAFINNNYIKNKSKRKNEILYYKQWN